MRLRIPIYSFLVYPTFSVLCDILGGLGADLASGVVGGVYIALSGGVGAGDGGWRG